MTKAPSDTRPELSTTAKFIRVLGRANQAEQAFLDQLVDAWMADDRIATIQEASFDVVTKEAGLELPLHLQDISDWKSQAADLNAVFAILQMNAHSPVATALEAILQLQRDRSLNRLEDMLSVIEGEMREEDERLRIARATLKEHPEILNDL